MSCMCTECYPCGCYFNKIDVTKMLDMFCGRWVNVCDSCLEDWNESSESNDRDNRFFLSVEDYREAKGLRRM